MTLREYNKDYTECKPGTAAACATWTRAAQAYLHVLPRGVRLLARVGETPVKFIAVPLRHADLVGARGQTLFKTRETNQVRIFNPCFCTTASSLSAAPLGRFAPVSHFSTVLSLVLR